MTTSSHHRRRQRRSSACPFDWLAREQRREQRLLPAVLEHVREVDARRRREPERQTEPTFTPVRSPYML